MFQWEKNLPPKKHTAKTLYAFTRQSLYSTRPSTPHQPVQRCSTVPWHGTAAVPQAVVNTPHKWEFCSQCSFHLSPCKEFFTSQQLLVSPEKKKKQQFNLLAIHIALCAQWGSLPQANHSRDRSTSALFYSSKESASFLVPLRMQEVCLTPPREDRAVPAPFFSQQPVTAASLGSMRPWVRGARFWWWPPWWLFLLLPAQGQPHHWLKQQPEEAARTQGWRGEAGVLLPSLPAQLARTFGSLSGLEWKMHRETGQFQTNFFSLPLSHCPTLAALLNSSPTALPGCRHHSSDTESPSWNCASAHPN